MSRNACNNKNGRNEEILSTIWYIKKGGGGGGKMRILKR